MRLAKPLQMMTILILLGTGASCSSPSAPSSMAPAVFVGAGDIGECGSAGPEETARLLDGIPGTVFTAGDNAYRAGTAEQFANCYDPSWGRHKSRTRPAPGNHDYATGSADPYYGYFGAVAGPAGQGYYSYNLGTWHVVSLNSNVPADDGSAQVAWLRNDLAAHPATCTLAYWHHPMFSTGAHGNDARMLTVWRVLYAAGADVIVNGHDHDYERFTPQTPDGLADQARGIREFVVGTGGHSSRPSFASVNLNSEARAQTLWGVLKLTLRGGSYDWEFIPAPEYSFHDSGTGVCSSDLPQG